MDVENSFDSGVLDEQMSIDDSKHITLRDSANNKASKLKQGLCGFQGAIKIRSNRFDYTKMKNALGVFYGQANTVIASVRYDLLLSVADANIIKKFMQNFSKQIVVKNHGERTLFNDMEMSPRKPWSVG